MSEAAPKADREGPGFQTIKTPLCTLRLYEKQLRRLISRGRIDGLPPLGPHSGSRLRTSMRVSRHGQYKEEGARKRCCIATILCLWECFSMYM
jgi:hypothetical protein